MVAEVVAEALVSGPFLTINLIALFAVDLSRIEDAGTRRVSCYALPTRRDDLATHYTAGATASFSEASWSSVRK